MDMYLARQPIFNSRKEAVAYELLYRSSFENVSKFVDGDAATLTVINNTALSMDINTLTSGRRAFINFTKKLVTDELPTLFPPDSIVVEILEDVEPDERLIESIVSLKKKGYVIALDDFVTENIYDELIQYADIIKVDFMLTDSCERAHIVRKHSNGRVAFLAEKVETEEEFEEAKRLGYTYFQGYFFAKPIIVKGKDIKGFKGNYISIFQEASVPEPDIKKIAEIIERDVALSYKLLRLINSPAFYSVSKITHISHAIMRLGVKELRKWIAVIMLNDLAGDKPDEIIKISLTRARLAEELSRLIFKCAKKQEQEMFLAGLFSMIDVLMDRPISELMHELPISDDIKDALSGVDNNIHKVLKIIDLYEKGEWEKLDYECCQIGLDGHLVFDEYYSALRWTKEVGGSGV